MSRLTHIAALFLATCLACLAACSDESCSDNGSSLPLAALYLNGSQQTVTGLTIRGIGAPGDSLLTDSASLSEVYLPLQATTGSTRFAISRYIRIDTIGSWRTDTLTLDYKAVEYFHSTECGAMFNFDIQDVRCTHHAIDSVEMLTTMVTNSRTPAMRIHFTDFSQ